MKSYKSGMTVHGLSRVLDSENHIVERLAWALFILFGFSIAAFVTSKLWNSFFENRVVTVYTKYKDVYILYFPSLTICHYNKFKTMDTTPSSQNTQPVILPFYDLLKCSHDAMHENCLKNATFGIGAINYTTQGYRIAPINQLLSFERDIGSVCASFNINGSSSTRDGNVRIDIGILENPNAIERSWYTVYFNSPGERYYQSTTNSR